MRDDNSVRSRISPEGTPYTTYNTIPFENNNLLEFNGRTYPGFYISWNSHDRRLYGDVTTALVIGQMQGFFILNGDHREQYLDIANQGFEKCVEYFITNADQRNEHSDTISGFEELNDLIRGLINKETKE